MNRTFDYDTEYTREQIEKATPITFHEGDEGILYLIADTPDTEYWFVRSGHYWKLDHTWGHFLLAPSQKDERGVG